MKTMLALATSMFLFSGFSYASCPERTTSLYEGEPMTVRCYLVDRVLHWRNVVELCLTEEQGTIAFEQRADGEKQLVGVCNGTVETYPSDQ